jgi:cytochrome oxidase Cu insertion factor (SCO1/SenC/PrrC family)
MTSGSHKQIAWTVVVGLALVFGILLCLVAILLLDRGPTRASTALPVIGPVADFQLTNQHNTAVSLEDLKGRVWVGDIIFTRCAGPCPEMTRKMRELQEALPADSQSLLITLTTDADYDTPEILRRYAERFDASTNNWIFLTGDKVEIATLAIDSLKLTAIEKKPEERTDPVDLFVHSTIFVIVDKQGRLRGAFETVGEDVNWMEMKQQILEAVSTLEDES